jgi:hypothetical protein
MLVGRVAERYQSKRNESGSGLVQIVVYGHVGLGGLQKGINQRERRVAVWVGAGCYFWHVGWGEVQSKGINQRERRV